MYWPSVQDNSTSASTLATSVTCVAQRLFSRPAPCAEMKYLQGESLSEVLVQPVRAMIQPITDVLSHRLRASATIFSQSVQSTSTCRGVSDVHRRRHEPQPDCPR